MRPTSTSAARKDTNTNTLHNYFTAASGANIRKTALSAAHACSNRRCPSETKTSIPGIVNCPKREKTMAAYFTAVPGAKKRKIRWEKYFEYQINSLALYQVPIKRQCANDPP